MMKTSDVELCHGREWLAVAVSFVLSGLSVEAEDVAVTDYSWLQIPDGIVAGVGGPSSPFNTNGMTGNGTAEWYRWGKNAWIPNETLTAYGTNDYWAAIQLDQPREVHSVSLQFWASEGAELRRFKIEGSVDATNFIQIGAYDYGSFVINPAAQIISVTSGTYRVVRIRMNGTSSQPGDPDYHPGTMYRPDRGGPGVGLLEPFGNGSVDYRKLNVVNASRFGTVGSYSAGLGFPWTGFNNGTLFDGNRVGEDMPWTAGEYFQINLAEPQTVFRSILVGDDDWGALTAGFSYSADGTSFQAVSGLSPPLVHGYQFISTEYTFTPTLAQYWRVTNATAGGYALFNQWMLYAFPPPRGTVIMIR